MKELLFEYPIVLIVIFIAGANVAVRRARRWFQGAVCQSKERLDGKTVIITESNSGIGKETAREMVRRGAKVIMACEDFDKANEAAKDIMSDPKAKGHVVVKYLDLASFESIHKFANDTLQNEKRIDILINNAELLLCQKDTTDDGFDLVFGANHLGPFLLTNLLLERIKASSPARIINISSFGHRFGSMNWEDLNYQKPKSYSPFRAYTQSKLANILFTRELADKLRGTGVTTYVVHPGIVATDFNPTENGCALDVFSVIIPWLFFKDPIQGAQTTIFCAVDETIKNKSGLYYKDCAETNPSKRARSKEDAERLWEQSVKMVHLDKID